MALQIRAIIEDKLLAPRVFVPLIPATPRAKRPQMVKRLSGPFSKLVGPCLEANGWCSCSVLLSNI